MSAAALLLPAGPRALLAAAGAVTLAAGVWHVDRTWDEKGSEAYAKAKKAIATPSEPVKIPISSLDAAFPFPWAFLLGWLIFGASYFFPVSGAWGVSITTPGIVAAVFSLALGVIASVPMGDAVRNRNGAKKKKLSAAFVLSWLGLTVSTGLSTAQGGLSFALCGMGAVSIIASMKILWKNRKMGDTWEQEGRPNPNPVVYNLGGPLFVWGWFLFVVGAVATSTPLAGASVLPIFFNLRTALAFFAGCGMVPVVMMLDYAHDEGAKYVGFGTDGRYFGRFFESPAPFLIMWTIFGAANLVPGAGQVAATLATRQWLIFGTCILQGIDAGVLIQTALYEGDMDRKNKWSIGFVLLFLSLAFNMGYTSRQVLALALPGTMMVILGQKTVFGDRKRGDYFMMNQASNPNPIVYSVGEPLFMAGWILLSLAMSLAV